jgi:hypothetical protein
MIHLKRFNEAVSDWDLNLVRKFCYENLAYLLDGPADIEFGLSLLDKNDIKVSHYRVMIKDINSKWSDIEADICPFLELLEEKYNLVNIITNNQIEFKFKTFSSNERLWFSINEILAGCIEENMEISAMRFVIEL